MIMRPNLPQPWARRNILFNNNLPINNANDAMNDTTTTTITTKNNNYNRHSDNNDGDIIDLEDDCRGRSVCSVAIRKGRIFINGLFLFCPIISSSKSTPLIQFVLALCMDPTDGYRDTNI